MTIVIRVCLLSALLFIKISAPAASQASDSGSKDPASKDVVKEQILVTATRSTESLDTSSASATVFSEAELESTPALVIDDLLRSTPGFSLFRRSSSLIAQPTSQGVSLRGIGPSGVSRTLVLLDGLPLNDPFGGWITWSRAPLPALERVEIVRGGGSNVWGSSALGGVIQLFTAKPEGFSSRVLLEAGDRSTGHADLAISKATNSWRADGHFNALDYGGYRQIREDQRGAIDIATDAEHWQADGRIGVSFSDAFELTGTLEHFDEDRSNGTPLTDNATELDVVSLHAEIETGARGSWSFRTHFQDQEFSARFSSQASDRATERPALDQFLVAAERLGVAAVWRNRVDSGSTSHSLVVGVDGRNTEGATNERFFFSEGDFIRERTAGGDEEVLGVFVQDTLSLGERAELQLGIRFDRWEGSGGFRQERNRSDGSIRLDQTFSDRSEDAVSPRVGLSYAMTDRWRLKGAAYGAFRAPTINELYRPFRVRSDITAANAELVPEELLGAELGVAGSFGRWQLGGTLFYNQLDDPVANVTIGFGPGLVAPCGFTPGGGSCRQRQNLDRSIVQGAEAEVRVRLPRATLDLAYQYSDAEVARAANAPDLEGLRLAQVPRNSASLRLDASLARRWSGEVGVRYADSQFEDDLNLRVLDSYLLAQLGLRFVASEQWTLFFRVENVFDEDVEVARTGNGLFTIGAPRTLRAGLRWSFLP